MDYTAEGNQVSSSYYYEASLNYNRTFREKHNITGLLVGVLRENKSGGASSIQTSLPARNIGLSGRFTYAYDILLKQTLVTMVPKDLPKMNDSDSFLR